MSTTLVRLPAAATTDPRTREERAMMDRARLGDREAVSTLFERHANRLRRLAYLMLHDQESAEDVVQETFERCLSAIGSYRGDGSPQAWLSSIAVNVCRHRLREEKIEAEIGEERTLDHGRPVRKERTRGVVTGVSVREDLRRLAIAMGYLTPAQREVFILHYHDDLPYEEIGEILGIRPGAARALAHRAKATLRERLAGPGNGAAPPA